MRKTIISINLLFILMFLVFSCKNEKKVPVYMDEDETSNVSYEGQPEDEVVVPFREENGVKYVNVKVNGIGLEMIFDTGCSGTLISVAEANYLYQKGYLSGEDLIGVSQSQIADGSIIENMVINLKEVIIDNKLLCSDVTATVSANINAPLLLGNEILDRLATIKIDNENKALIFKLK